MRRMLLAAVAFSVAMVAGCSSGSPSSPTTSTSSAAAPTSSTSGPTTTLPRGGSRSAEEAVLAYIDAASKDQWGRVWDGLHPAQKALFTREKFIDCGAAPGFTVEHAEVVDT